MKGVLAQDAQYAGAGHGKIGGAAQSSILLRLGLICTGLVVLQTAASLWGFGESFWRPASLALSVAAWFFGMTCFVLAMVTRVPARAQWLILAGLVGALWGLAYIERLNDSPLTISHTDNEMISEYASEALKRANNPYTWNFTDHARVYRDRGLQVTTFLNGSVQNRVTYPALPTLTLIAFGALGLGGARDVSLVFLTLMLVLLFAGTPRRLRPVILLPLFVAKSFNLITLHGGQDIVWSALLVAMVLAWKRPTLRAVLFGLACAYRQQPWLAAPFLLIYLWNEPVDPEQTNARRPLTTMREILQHPRLALNDPRLRGILYFTALSGGVFLLVNLPFMLWDLRAWVLGVFEPIYAAFNVYSQGLGALSQHNLAPFPRTFYTGLQFSALTLMLWIHLRHPRVVGQAFWVFPGIFFFFFYRGLTNYWIYWIPPLLIAVVRHRWHDLALTERNSRWYRTLIMVAIALIVNLLYGIFLLQRQPEITISLLYPLETYDERNIARLALTVTNTTDESLRPRFAVQFDGMQPLPWEIEAGPERLKPGESGEYIIRTFSRSRTFSIARGAQVVVTDASNDYRLRTVIDIPGDPTFNSPDRILNPSFTLWSPSQASPAAWSWSASEGDIIRPRFDMIDGRSSLVLSVQRGDWRLSQTVTFPDTFSIWVRPTDLANAPLEAPYGLEIDDGQHRLWVLFGDQAGISQTDENFGIVYMPAPVDQWSRQTINPPEYYARFGWELPDYTLRNRQGIEFAARQVTLSLLVSGTQVSQAFGAIEQAADFASPQALVADAIEHPDDYYVNMGNEYCRQRNYDLATIAFQQALQYNPANAHAQQGLETCR